MLPTHKFIPIALLISFSFIQNVFGQEKRIAAEDNDAITKNEAFSSKTVNWSRITSNQNYTYREIVAKCDSIFAIPGNVDTASDVEESPYIDYCRWKKFWETRLDASTGKLHNFGNGVLEKITPRKSLAGNHAAYSPGSLTDCNGTSALQTSLGSIAINGTGWSFIGPQNVAPDGASVQHLGRPTQIMVNPNNPNEVYASSTWGGLWKSVDALSAPNNHWVCLTDNSTLISGIGVIKFDVDFNPAYPHHHIFLALGYPAYFSYYENSSSTVGLFSSADDGLTYQNIDESTLIPNFNADIIGDIKLWPGNTTAGPNFLYVTTKYKLLKINITNVALPSPTFPTIAIVDFLPSLLPLSNYSQRFPGLGSLGAIPADNSQMYLTTLSTIGNGYPMGAHLYKIPTALTATGTPSDITQFLYEQQSNVIIDGTFTSDPTTVSGGYLWAMDPGWAWSSANHDMEYTPTSLHPAACLHVGIDESYMTATTYTVGYKLVVPPNTTVHVYLSDYPSTTCGAVQTNIATYDNTTAAAETLTVSVPITATGAGALVFSASQNSGTAFGTAPITLSNLSVNQSFFDYIANLSSSPAAPGNLFCITSDQYVPNTPQMQSLTTSGSGTGWTHQATGGGSCMAVSRTNANTMYLGTIPGSCPGTVPVNVYNYSSGITAAITPSEYAVAHTDCRSLCEYYNSTSGLDYLYIGSDGGLAYMKLGSSPSWTNMNGTGFTCSLPWGIASSIHNGNVSMGFSDNNILKSNENSLGSWSMIECGDGGDVVYGKRTATRNTLFFGESGGGGTATLNSQVSAGTATTAASSTAVTPTFTPAPYLSVSEQSLCKVRTTFNNEYVPVNNGGNHDIYVETVAGTGPYTGSWKSITSTPSSPVPTGGAVTPNASWPNEPVRNIAPDMYDPNFVAAFVTTSFWDPGIFAITVNGTTAVPNWKQYTNTTGGYITDICADPRSSVPSKRLWASAGWYTSPGSNRVFVGQYTGSALTWSDYSTGLPAGPVNVLVYDEQSHYLFAGTDMGVYARWVDDPSHGPWQCYSLKLPNSFITGLDINRCTGKIYASCVGRGGYEADLPQDANWNGTVSLTDQCDVNYISTSTTWTTDRDETRSIIIPSGVTLIIKNCTLSMGRNKNIIVKSGGELVVDNATITNSCGSIWGCINVLGNPSVTQNLTNVFAPPFTSSYPTTNQGLVVLTNNAIIENAYVGVFNGGSYYDGLDAPDYISGSDGGLILADNTTFHNCVSGVIFNPYSSTQNSSFNNCSFIADDTLQHPRYIDYTISGYPNNPRPFGSVRGIWNTGTTGVQILNTSFKSVLSPTAPPYFNPDVDLRGVGYLGTNSYATINGCTFSNLTRGIFDANYVAGYYPIIQNNTFSNCWRSISIGNVNNALCKNNTITVGVDPLYLGGITTGLGSAYEEYGSGAFGISYSQGSIFNIKYNTISGTDGSGWAISGIVINATKSSTTTMLSNNKLYGNTISGIDYGVTSLQDNRGLQIQCNSITGISTSAIHIAPSSGAAGRLTDQGYCGSVSTMASNQFPTWSGSCPSYIDLVSDYGDPNHDFTYFQPNNNPYIAHCYSTSYPWAIISSPVTCGFAYSSSASCPVITAPIIGPGGLTLNGAISALAATESNIATLQSEVDGGNTAYLLSTIENPDYTSSYVTSVVCTYTPYLSDQVLLAAIQRSPALAYSDLKRIITGNSALEPSVMDTLSVAYDSLSLDTAVIAAQNVASARSTLYGQISDLESTRNDYISALTDYYILNNMWARVAQLYSDRQYYEQAFPYYMINGDWTSSASMIDSIPDTLLKQLLNIQLTHATRGYRMDSLSTSDSTILATIGSNPETHAGEIARIWYSQVYQQPYYELMPKDSTGRGLGRTSPGATTAVSPAFAADKNSEVVIQPNPAKDRVNLTLVKGAWMQGSLITATDISGQRILTISPQSGTTTIDINTSAWVSGFYMFIIQYGDGRYTTAKLVIKK